MLPKKIVGTAVLFFNNKDELLIVKPDYKEGWLVPGGSVEEKEAPLECAIRETKEEIGLDIPEMKLVGIFCSPKKSPQHFDSLKFIFFGGVLNEEQISQIKLQADELEEYDFKSTSEAMLLLSPSLQKSVPACLEAIKNKTFAYIEGK